VKYIVNCVTNYADFCFVLLHCANVNENSNLTTSVGRVGSR